MKERALKTVNGFKQFILRGNVVDMAVGIVIGASFSGVVNSLVENVLTPLIGAIIKQPDFSDLMFTINGSEFMYGKFLNALMAFLIVAAAIYFFVITPINALVARTKKDEKPLDPTTKRCPKCISEISIKATRCAFCTSEVN